MLEVVPAVEIDEAVTVEVVLDDEHAAGLVAVEFLARLGVALDVGDLGVSEDGDVVVSRFLGPAVEPEARGDFEVVERHGGGEAAMGGVERRGRD